MEVRLLIAEGNWLFLTVVINIFDVVAVVDVVLVVAAVVVLVAAVK